MSHTGCRRQVTLWKLGRQEVTVGFGAGAVVSDAGLLPVKWVERHWRVIDGLAERLPDPRHPIFVRHQVRTLLGQFVFQILAGYVDGNDAAAVRRDPLFQTLVDQSPGDDATLASGSTLSRFLYAFTRRQVKLPPEERTIWSEQQRAKIERLEVFNDYLVELFVRTRQQRPTRVIIDLDATDDAAHGHQQLTLWHGYFDQNQYFPLLAFDGESGFPLGAWLRPGTAHASWGAVDALRAIIAKLRAAWPEVEIVVRGDNGFAVPELYDFCEATPNVNYILGYATNDVLERRAADWLWHVRVLHALYREPCRRFDTIEDYQAGSWPHPRRVIAKSEITATGGPNRRFIVTNLDGDPRALYEDLYVQRGRVPERPIRELKCGLSADRLSSTRFFANALRFMCHVLAYAIVVLFRDAAAAVPEVATQEVPTLRARLWKAGAIVSASVRRISIEFAKHWPGRALFDRVCEAVRKFLTSLTSPPLPACGGLLK